MGYLYRTKRHGYDNIAVGSETGEERYVEGGRGTAANATSQLLERLNVSAEGTTGQTSNAELYVGVGGVSDGGSSDSGLWTHGATSPNIGDVPGSTSNSSFWTSGTSFATDVFPERVG